MLPTAATVPNAVANTLNATAVLPVLILALSVYHWAFAPDVYTLACGINLFLCSLVFFIYR
jgi:hypothetical protein